MKGAPINALSPLEIQLIHKHFDFTVGSEKPLALWVLGRPAAGKTTVASLLRDVLRWRGHRAEFIDGEHMRLILGGFYGFSAPDRMRVFKKYVDLNRILQSKDIIPVTATVGGTTECRILLRNSLVNAKAIYLACPASVAELRDQKGLYARAKSGELEHFADALHLFQTPPDCEMKFDSATLDPLEIVVKIMEYLNANKLLRAMENKV